MADASYQPKIYRQQGGERFVVASSGSLDVESGGELDIESGGALKIAGTQVTASAAELNKLDGVASTATEIDQRALTMDITLGTEGTAHVVVPWGGTVKTVYSVIDAALNTGDETLVFQNTGGTAMTGGTLTIAQSGSAAGDVDTVSPTGNNTFAAGDKLITVIGGQNGVAANCQLTFVFQIT